MTLFPGRPRRLFVAGTYLPRFRSKKCRQPDTMAAATVLVAYFTLAAIHIDTGASLLRDHLTTLPGSVRHVWVLQRTGMQLVF